MEQRRDEGNQTGAAENEVQKHRELMTGAWKK